MNREVIEIELDHAWSAFPATLRKAPAEVCLYKFIHVFEKQDHVTVMERTNEQDPPAECSEREQEADCHGTTLPRRRSLDRSASRVVLQNQAVVLAVGRERATLRPP